MVTTSVHYGFGRSVTTINPKDLPSAIKYDYLSHGFGLAGSLLARIAFTLYLINLLGATKIHRTILWTLLVIQLVINFITILFIYIQCPGHPSAIWDKSIKAYCWSPVIQSDLGYFTSCRCSQNSLFGTSANNCFLTVSRQYCNRLIPFSFPSLHILEHEFTPEA